ncbi:MAG: fibronectin type III domain-containing protein [Candidatus Krumholzibacteria bacterium]|jgi:hypothetical protein|nr:fibronectin type III domain-containing protein [Candidatus Krumholzibacteria bacterium]
MVRIAQWVVPALVLALCSLTACSQEDSPTGPTGGPAAGLPTTVGDLHVAAADSGSITLGWTAPGVPGKPQPVQSYDLRYTTLDAELTDWDTWSSAPAPAPAPPGTAQTAVVAALDPGSAWIFRLRSRSADLWSTLSAPVVASAVPDWDQTPPAAVDDLEMRWRSEQALLVSWSPTGDDGRHGAAAAYALRYAAEPLAAGNWEQASEAVGHVYDAARRRWTCQLAGLDPAQTVYLAVRAVDDAGNWSDLGNVAVGAPPAGTVWHVNVDGSGTVPTIGEGVARARPGDLVLVGPGHYTWTNQGGPMHDLGMIFVGRDTTGFTVASEQGPAATIIDAQQQGRVLFIQAYNNEIVFEGFTLTGGVDTPYDGDTQKAGGLVFHLTSTTIRDCVITGNSGGEGGGVYYGGVGRPTLERCIITNNHAGRGGGVYAVNVSGPGQDPYHGLSLIDCEITNNWVTSFGGGVCTVMAVVRLERTLIADNSAVTSGGGVAIIGHAMHPSPDTWVEFHGCTLARNQAPLGAAVRLTFDTQQQRVGRARMFSSIVTGHADQYCLSLNTNCQLEVGCCAIFGNQDGARLPGTAVDLGDNIYVDPLFCEDPAAPTWSLTTASPCLPGAHPNGAACGLIGARPAVPGC